MIDETRRKKVTITDKHRNDVLELFKNKFSYGRIAEITGIGDSTVRYIIRAYECVRDGKLDEIRATSNILNNVSQLKWACVANGIDPDGFIRSLANQRSKPDVVPEKDNTAACLADIEASIDVSTRLMTMEINKTLDTNFQTLFKKLDQLAVIIQSCAKNQLDKNNANADIAMKEFQKANETLNWIRSQTKNLRYVK